MIVMQVDLAIFIVLSTIVLLTEYREFSGTPPAGTGRQEAAGWEKAAPQLYGGTSWNHPAHISKSADTKNDIFFF